MENTEHLVVFQIYYQNTYKKDTDKYEQLPNLNKLVCLIIICNIV